MQNKVLMQICIAWLCCWVSMAVAKDLYPFSNPAEQERFFALTAQLRCLVCQNTSIADSNAPLAKDLRDRVYVMLRRGKSDSQIKAYLVARYGDFILFKPPLEPRTYILWLAPGILLLIGMAILAQKIMLW